MSFRSRLLVPSALLIAVPLLAACGDEEEPLESAHVVVADASGSANKVELSTEARDLFALRITEMEAPSTVTFMIFNTDVGSQACPPLAVSLATSDNSTAIDDTLAGYAAQAPAKAEEYVTCALGSTKGTDIFSGVANAATLLEGVEGERSIDLVTDGCNTTDLGELMARTCRSDITDPQWRERVLEALPPELSPDLTGISLTLTGLGRGAGIPGERVLSLREFWTRYAERLGATITING